MGFILRNMEDFKRFENVILHTGHHSWSKLKYACVVWFMKERFPMPSMGRKGTVQ